MERILLCVVVTSIAFAFLASRNRDAISGKVVWALALSGVFLLGLAGLLGRLFGQAVPDTFLRLGPANDMTMGVLLGVDLLYGGLLCLVWMLASRRANAT
jgi:hypothetical protein